MAPVVTPPVPTIMVTGFLGSGKTTFINALTQQLHLAGLRVGVLVNEVGETALDAQLVPGSDYVTEVLRGSIFCSCVRGDLIEAIRRLVDAVHPDVLVIEATGVADPGELGGFADHPDVTPLYRLAYTVCLAAANRLYKVAQTLAAARRQLAVADLVVVTGSDQAAPGELQQTLAAIAKYSSGAEWEVAQYARLPAARWQAFIDAVVASGPQRVGMTAPVPTDNEPLERARDVYSTRLLHVPPLPADRGADAITALLPNNTERAKGFVGVGGEVCVYHYYGGAASLDPAPAGVQATGLIVAIGRYPHRLIFQPRQ